MGDNKIVIPKKERPKGEDGHKVFSVRIKDDTVKSLDKLASENHYSRNELIQIFLEYGTQNCEVSDE